MSPAADPAGRGVLVTGAGHGIGAALAAAFAAAGARVVVNDLDAEAAEAVADSIGAYALPGDAADPTELIAAARAELGAIDVYCANAGVAPVGGADAGPAAWATAWDVNVMAHVRAAELLLPDWLERGEGRFVATVSAAGLLTMLGSAPYAVSKHGALAFAEWLAATYRHRGVRVHAVCPQGVRTRMLDEAGTAGQLLLADGALEPSAVADAVLRGIAEERFLILPHPEVAGYYATRATEPDRWLDGMNRLQQVLEKE
ncbi:NAD(P)-dependent dehydrogenase (short-subunit alcohol dehydrogenase family) [Kitasatospora gansuensis]|uniref:NAD(P)-dependent dehydrogenase (Short-subunit alcohol dehydrogenase family) n=1 Tax=Kitasatospora gansuensis TaxID=258050 RepID=A0A7W7SHC8_9ACTN|nr:SDR family oxidoreductase [Kitasatospora gansuensis]MBB4950402.1 NAD(P)-dependent dehydrogenase (short-subunit alcohol dehydrogenase family) [Kitasatospora gansuensis]